MSINYSKLPAHMREGVRLYVEEGVPPGGFLNAVLCNDLTGAYGRADEINKAAMQDWAEFLYWEMPSNLWHDQETVNAHLKRMQEHRAA